MSFTDSSEAAVLDWFLGPSGPAATTWLALLTGPPTDDGTTTVPEVSTSGTGYAREQITSWTGSGSSRASGNDVTFGPATSSWGTITHFGIFDAASGGNMVAWGTFGSSLTVTETQSPRVNAGECVVTLD